MNSIKEIRTYGQEKYSEQFQSELNKKGTVTIKLAPD